MGKILSFVSVLTTLSLVITSVALSQTKNSILFNKNWRFYLGDIKNAQQLSYDDDRWRKLDLPHDWSIEGKIDQKNPTGIGGGYVPAGIGWYRKSFVAPASWKGKQVSIYFEGVYMNSEVFINGKSLGVHPYGYTSFYYDLTPHLIYNGENVIAVRVNNSEQMNSRWYSGSGIYRHVWLQVNNQIHFKQWGISIITPVINEKKATIEIKTKLKNESAHDRSVVFSTKIIDKEKNIVASDDFKIDLQSKCEKEVTQKIIVYNPFLWSTDFPNLYNTEMKITDGKKTIDLENASFGIRSIKYNAEEGFLLNGKSIKLNGGCVHHDNGCLGAAAYDRAEERKVELLKSAGFNSVRTSHNPPSEAFLNACDRLGLMVIDELFDGWMESKNTYDYARFFNDWWRRDVESMVLRDRNHPSIIMWSTGNEIIERKKPEAVVTAKNLTDAIHKIDSTRPVTSAMTTWDNDWNIFDPLMAAHDICGYNYQLHRAPYDHVRVPSRVIVHTESYPADAFKNWEMVQNNNYIIGDFVWTAIDYLGESGIGRYFYPGEPKGEHWQGDFYPWHGAYCGDINLIGWRKPISHYRNILWNENEKLYMAVKEPNPKEGEIKTTLWSVWPTWESWNWHGSEGKNIDVEVYSKYPEVKIYLNDELIGEKTTTKEQEYKTVFSIPYSPGTLKAVGVMNGREVESRILTTANQVKRIILKPDREIINADGQDLSFVTVELTDENGIIQPDADNFLQFKINGPGEIIGVDNANLKDLNPYVSSTRKAWHGRAIVVIKSNEKAGDIKLTVSSSGLRESSVLLHTKKKL